MCNNGIRGDPELVDILEKFESFLESYFPDIHSPASEKDVFKNLQEIAHGCSKGEKGIPKCAFAIDAFTKEVRRPLEKQARDLGIMIPPFEYAHNLMLKKCTGNRCHELGKKELCISASGAAYILYGLLEEFLLSLCD
jgi:hypothetical protein